MIAMAMKKKRMVLISILVVLIGIALAGVLIFTNADANLKQLVNIPISEVDLSKIDDGVYKGSYKSFPIAAEVEVTVKDHAIKQIDLIKHENGQGAKAEIIPDRVVGAQSLKVDTVSGATYSSKVILKAIENALINANNK